MYISKANTKTRQYTQCTYDHISPTLLFGYCDVTFNVVSFGLLAYANHTLLFITLYFVAGLSPVLWIAFGTARSTLSGRISWIFLGTIESSPSFRAWVLLVDWLAAPPVGWTYCVVSANASSLLHVREVRGIYVSYLIWQRLLETLGCGILYRLWYRRLALCVGLALAVLVCGHPWCLG
jgi:hypothetical protein